MQKNLMRSFLGRSGISRYLLRFILIICGMALGITPASAGKPFSAVQASGSAVVESPQQQVTVTGRILDQTGQPLTGVTVLVKGTTAGTLTDLNGRYTLPNVLSNATLVFTFVGMAPQEIQVNGQTNVDIIMKESTLTLDEVVVVGYGQQKKESIVGSIAQTTNEKLKQTGNVTNLASALTGQLPGVITLTASGEPGGPSSGQYGVGNSGTALYIRGRNTWNGGQPLILVDGIERDMYNLDISEVENVSILKDASATAVFGVKGANGVILITTKRGSVGKTQISFTYNTTAMHVSKLPETARAFEAQAARNEAIERELPLREASWGEIVPYEISKRHLHNDPNHPEYEWIYPDVDWEKWMFKDVATAQRATLNVRGGTDFVSYFGSIAYLKENDILKNYDNQQGYNADYSFDRFNFRSNLDFKLTRTTNLAVNFSGYYSNKNNNFDYSSVTWGTLEEIWGSVYGMPPDLYMPIYPDGRFGFNAATFRNNPVTVANAIGLRYDRATSMNNDIAIDQKLDFITKGLSAKGQFFYDNVIITEGAWANTPNSIQVNQPWSHIPSKYVNSAAYRNDPTQDPAEYVTDLSRVGTANSQFDWYIPDPTINNEAVIAGNTQRRMQYQFQLNYARRFGLHNVGLLGVMKRQEYARGSMFRNYREDWVFRTTYDYDSKYLLEMNGAYNGTEQFGTGYRFDFFPSIALGYVISNEKFWKISQINRLKLRYSVGVVGDDNVSGGRWQYSDQYAYGGSVRMVPTDMDAVSPYTWYRQSVVGNPDLHWEKAKKSNYGVEIGLFKDLFSINYDYFTEHRTDMLLTGSSRAIPPYFGGSPPSANIGEVKSSGHEFEIKLDKRTPRYFHYWASLALTHTENTVIFKDSPVMMADYLKPEGYMINQRRSLIRADRYENWDDIYASVPMETNDNMKLPGMWNIIDFNADGMIKTSQDQIPTGYSEIPQNTMNLSLGADYKGFSAMVQLYGVNNVTRGMVLPGFNRYFSVWFTHMRDYWSKDNPDGASYMPRWRATSGQGNFYGDYWLWDGSYMRIKTAEIAYTFQQGILQKTGLSALRIYINGNNLAFWSDMLDDREGSFAGGGDNQGAYPSVARYNLGIDITF
jgi:TonB-linked SusC/RagA family outer membrane protein